MMADIVRGEQQPVIDYTGRDYTQVLRALREEAPRKLPEWKDFGNEADFGNVMLELFAYITDILSYYQDRVANESFLSTAVTRRSVIEHLRLIGYRMRTAAPAAATLTITLPPGTAAPHPAITLERGAAFATKSRQDAPSVRFEYARASAWELDFTPGPAASGSPLIAEIPVEEGRLIVSDVVGLSEEAPDQRYPLTHRGLILKPTGPQDHAGPDVVVTTAREGQTDQRWSYRDSLAFSESDSLHFTIDIDENDQAAVVFGDGWFGAIPPRGATVKVTYRVGGGTTGNVPADAIVSIVEAPALAKLGAKVTNRTAATGGADRESIEHAVAQAPAVFRSQGRAVTTDDYEALARSFDGVGKVRASATGWNRVTLFVAPAGGGNVTDSLELGLKRFLEDKRMLTQIVEVEDVDPVPVFVTAKVGIESYFLPEDVIAAIERAAGELLAFDRVDFGQTVYLSRFYDAVQSTPGVRFVNITEFRRPDQAKDVEPEGRIRLRENEIPIPPVAAGYTSGIRVIKEDEE
jgi:hypothetical protein